jgi:glucose-1-phosphate cytidylyltransferase
MKVVILAGGYGTRLAEYTHSIPKPMVPIGGKPIIWHIMKSYSKFGFNEFIIALGYKSDVIKEYFLNYNKLNSNFSINLQSDEIVKHDDFVEDWKITLVDTGLDTMTGGRLKRLEKHLFDGTFFATYGDGLSDINFKDILKFHKNHGKLATVSAVRPAARFGLLSLNQDEVIKFEEKPQVETGRINGGFFVLEPEVLDYIDNDESIWEREPLCNLAETGNLNAFKHNGFWQCADTVRDIKYLEDLCRTKKMHWL